MKKALHLCLVLAGLALLSPAKAQLFKIDLNEKVRSSSLIAEGKVIDQRSFWDDAHIMIYTANTIQVYKTFKGKTTERTIEVITQGGQVGADAVEVSDLLGLQKGQVGLFFCFDNELGIKSPSTSRTLYDVYSSAQGFLKYDLVGNKAYAPFADYTGIENNLYNEVEKQTGETRKIMDASFSVANEIRANAENSRKATAKTLATITSFSPATVHAGAINDPTNNVLTITGTGFSNKPDSAASVNFTDGNSDNVPPDYKVNNKSAYIISWTDKQIIVRVPGRAATGKISVTVNKSTVQSATDLTVYFAVQSYEFNLRSIGIDTSLAVEPHLMNANANGGYTYSLSTSTAGKGINIAADDSAKAAFARAVATWQQIAGANIVAGANSTKQAVGDDGINLVEYDNTKTGVPNMAAGVLEVTYSYPTFCYIPSPFQAFAAQRKGFDILLRNPKIGAKADIVNFAKGPCFLTVGTYDLEHIMLHELGHALNLSHINSNYEASPATYQNANPPAVMHFAVLDYVDRRSPDNSAYTAAIYSITPQHRSYGGCKSAFSTEMVPLDYTPLISDECPGTFPTVATKSGTILKVDLVHATSNRLKDPKFTQIDPSGNGVPVTNNAWFAIKTSATGNSTLLLNVTAYKVTPTTEATCVGQGIRMAVYKASACPVGQAFPKPVAYTTFNGNGQLPNITGLAANTNYLIYFDGLRNTKANFTVTLNGSALPVKLVSFTGEYIHGANNLYIDMADVINVKEVIVEKSADGGNFAELGALNVPSSQLAGNHTYSDLQPYALANYYRLKVVDEDGNVQYSNILQLKNPATTLVYVYPNPAKNNASVSFSGTPAGRYNLRVYNLAGKAVYNGSYVLSGGNQLVNLPLTGIATGIYLVKVTNARGETIAQQKVVKE